MKKKNDNDIDLIDIFINIWNEKIKVVFVVILLLVIYFVTINVIKKTYYATTEINPISTFNENLYFAYNSTIKNTLNKPKDNNNNEEQKISYFNEINKKFLLKMFIEKLNDKSYLKEAIKKFELVQRKDYESQDLYEDAVEFLASTAIVLPPKNSKKDLRKDDFRGKWTINFTTENKQKWESAISYTNKEINKFLNLYFQKQFIDLLNAYKRENKFLLEDLETQILNTKEDYENETSQRLNVLIEQAKIARQLGIAKNTIEVQNFASKNLIISNLQKENSYYLKGYEMIEKEIELINSRTNKKAFTKKIYGLEKQKRSLLQSKDLERLNLLFQNTPIMNSNNFVAATINHRNTKYVMTGNQLSLPLVIFISAICAIIYVSVSSAIKNRK